MTFSHSSLEKARRLSGEQEEETAREPPRTGKTEESELEGTTAPIEELELSASQVDDFFQDDGDPTGSQVDQSKDEPCPCPYSKLGCARQVSSIP